MKVPKSDQTIDQLLSLPAIWGSERSILADEGSCDASIVFKVNGVTMAEV
jgi:hypothetical protein